MSFKASKLAQIKLGQWKLAWWEPRATAGPMRGVTATKAILKASKGSV